MVWVFSAWQLAFKRPTPLSTSSPLPPATTKTLPLRGPRQTEAGTFKCH